MLCPARSSKHEQFLVQRFCEKKYEHGGQINVKIFTFCFMRNNSWALALINEVWYSEKYMDIPISSI